MLSNAFRNLLTPGLVTIGILGVALLPTKPASAQLLEDLGIGAAAGIVTGTFIGDDVGLDDAINGAAAGAAVNAADNNLNNRDSRNLGQDVGVGAAASGVAGIITNDDSFVENAIQGAAAGAVINLFGD